MDGVADAIAVDLDVAVDVDSDAVANTVAVDSDAVSDVVARLFWTLCIVVACFCCRRYILRAF